MKRALCLASVVTSGSGLAAEWEWEGVEWDAGLEWEVYVDKGECDWEGFQSGLGLG